ncbi:MAG: hypothetical protein NZL92_12225, partial [Gloeomargarita sp. SKYG116]|nr:hypothetical protein [Gloeomargarita sp. SKYG116]MDW8402446.1 hypothetical protein [Gloeomargarita sp. SKYGB_i_bin116]
MFVSIPHTGIKNLRQQGINTLIDSLGRFNPAYRDKEFETRTSWCASGKCRGFNPAYRDKE